MADRNSPPSPIASEVRPDLSAIISPEEEQIELTDQLCSLVPLGVPVHTFMRENVHKMFLSVAQYLKAVKNLTSITDVKMLSMVFQAAVKADAAPLPNLCTEKSIYLLAKWIKKGPGARALALAQHSIKIDKKTAPGFSSAETSYAILLEQQIQDLIANRKEIRTRHEEEILRLQRRIDGIRRQIETDIRRGDRAFVPANNYAPLDKAELSAECWARFVAELAEFKKPIPAWSSILQPVAEEKFAAQVQREHKAMFCRGPGIMESLRKWADSKILQLRAENSFVRLQGSPDSWVASVERRMWRIPLPQREVWADLIPIGPLVTRRTRNQNRTLRELLPPNLFSLKCQVGNKKGPPLAKGPESRRDCALALLENPRIQVLRRSRRLKNPVIPTARSKFEAGVRRVIGGGELRTWASDSNKYRGGGCLSDALLLLATASYTPPEEFLSDYFSVDAARNLLSLPAGIPVPMGPDAVVMSNFNNDATSGPFLRAFGIKDKYGIKADLERFAWKCYEGYVSSGCDGRFLPFILARVGYRTKLLNRDEAFEKMREGKPLGRAVMMLDAIEQPLSSPLYNVLSKLTAAMRREKDCGFRNAVVRASSDWLYFWEEVRDASVIVELDWKKFDRERPSEDLAFMIDVILSCFEPRNDQEAAFLKGYGVMLRRSLIERLFVTDDGGVFGIEGMVPSGSLWTGWLDTALNILYLKAALIKIGVPSTRASPKCAGDDNLTLFWKDFPDRQLLRLRDVLNSSFRAGIEPEDFIIHRPPFHVTKEQACFPEGTDLKRGTSKILEFAEWRPFEGRLHIDQAAGLSHRWRYVFEGKPKFLSCYWLENGRPIRPTYVNAEKLLWPEGIHKSVEDYKQAVVAMVVDNPWNQHNVNHMMHRFVICEQVRRLSSVGIDPEDILWFAKIRPVGKEDVPYPMVGSWRRVDEWVDMERLPSVRKYVEAFSEFVSQVTTLSARDPVGGIDSWKFAEFIRGESDLGEGQYGNEIDAWLGWLRNNPISRFLRPIKRLRDPREARVAPPEVRAALDDCLQVYADVLGTPVAECPGNFALFLSDVILNRG
ncbi:RNA-dependent RNA polymerase [Lily amalgavirus 1]|nr:RNA-dependent RNA polymerase [Lily amalgavirus 1]WDU66003.1 RNA-dependent RNA polymerase [Lily amalgavirus 1]